MSAHSFVFEHCTKLYGEVIGVNDIHLELAPGAHGLLGPNGSGKSTLLNLITGQLRPTLGSLRVLGTDPWSSRALRRRLGYCPEADVLYPGVSGLELVRYLLRLHGFGRHDADQRARTMLERLAMGEKMERPIRTYSRGMRQRTKLASALAHEPELLVLDEPLNGLDPIGRHDVTGLLSDWVAEGRTLIVASHVLHEVQALTDQFMLIHGGRVIASGRAGEIRELLGEVPHQITLRCADPAALGRELLDGELVEGVEIDMTAGRLVLQTRFPGRLYARLPGAVRSAGQPVTEMTSPQECLESVFDYMMARI